MNAYRTTGTDYSHADYSTVNYNTSPSGQYQKCYNSCMKGYDYPFSSTSGYELDRSCSYGAICRMNPLRGSRYRLPYSRGDSEFDDQDSGTARNRKGECSRDPFDPDRRECNKPQPSTESKQRGWSRRQQKYPANTGQNCAYKCSPGRLDLKTSPEVCDWCYQKCEGNLACINVSCPGCAVPKVDLQGDYPGMYYPRLH